MASKPNRPLYVPPAKRRQAAVSTSSASKIPGSNGGRNRPQRFHGAFTGGFSAGYYNTVGSKDGWKPSEERRRDQKLEDFMDDQDHEDWGGPTGVREEYNTASAPSTASGFEPDTFTKQANAGSTNSLQQFPLDRLFQVSHQTVGPRLLRILGWREERETGESAAYVNGDKDDTSGYTDAAAGSAAPQQKVGIEQSTVLSTKRLRKIRLQQSRTKLPHPKLDQCGLGFEPYADAPEFRQFKERRKQLARDRARGGNSRDVYRTSHIAGHIGGKESSTEVAERFGHNDDAYVSYETAEDFIGKKTSAGFAMRDDEDDAYDDNDTGNSRSLLSFSTEKPGQLSSSIRVSRDDYNTEVYEHASSDENEEYTPLAGRHKEFDKRNNQDFGGVLSAFANTSTTLNEQQRPGLGSNTSGFMSDGRAPLEGFVLGGSIQTHVQRYPGPDVPINEELQRHMFGPNEHPLVFQTLSRAVHLELQEEQNKCKAQEEAKTLQRLGQEVLEQSKQKLSTNSADRSQLVRAMAGDRFSGLARAMKSRFTSGNGEVRGTRGTVSSDGRTGSDGGAPPTGLHIPQTSANKSDVAGANKAVTTTTVPTEIKLKRTIQAFVAHPLVCKRFRVQAPKHQGASLGGQVSAWAVNPNEVRSKESEYFEKEILTIAAKRSVTDGVSPSGNAAPTESTEASSPRHGDTDDEQIGKTGEIRVPLDTLKSIFDPDSDSSDSSEDEGPVDVPRDLGPENAIKSAAVMDHYGYALELGQDSLRRASPQQHNGAETSKQQPDAHLSVVEGDKPEIQRKRRQERKGRRRSRDNKVGSDDESESASSSSQDEDSYARHRKRRKKERRRDRKRRRAEKKGSRKSSFSSKRKRR